MGFAARSVELRSSAAKFCPTVERTVKTEPRVRVELSDRGN